MSLPGFVVSVHEPFRLWGSRQQTRKRILMVYSNVRSSFFIRGDGGDFDESYLVSL